MQQRKLGRTGLAVTRMGLGLAALGRPGYINLDHADALNHNYEVDAMRAHTHTVLDAAWVAGIRYFDAARSYGRAEEFLASWLVARGIAPVNATIGSKWGYTYTADWQVDAEVHEVKEHSLDVLTRQRQETHQNLGQHLDLYQVHSATLSSGIFERTEVLEELARMRDAGLGIGLSLSGPGQPEALRRAMAIEIGGEPVFATVQATWNLLERSCGPVLAEAHAAGMGVLVKEAVANGRLTPANDNPAFAEQRALLQAVADEQGVSIDAVALAGVLAQPWCDVVLSGAASVDHLESNVRAFDVEWDGSIDDRLAGLVEAPESYWQTRDELAWN